jgi:tetratricopeptide (TPR) repeat protein
MAHAFADGDFAKVLSLNQAVEKDFALKMIFKNRDEIYIEAMDLMARTYCGMNEHASAMTFYKKEIAMCVAVKDSSRHAKCLSRFAACELALGHVDDATATYKTVQGMSEESGDFLVLSMALVGLSHVANRTGHKQEALEMAEQSLIAAGLMLDGQYTKSRHQATAITTIIECSDINLVCFDETLITRLLALAKEINETEPEGSIHVVSAALWACRRHCAMGRHAEALEQCNEILLLAKQKRFMQVAGVQYMADAAKHLTTFMGFMGLGLGVVEGDEA